MNLGLEFYELVASIIPLFLVALAVERFRIDADDDDRARFRTGLWALAALISSESLTLGVLAAGARTRGTDIAVMCSLGIGLVFLAAAYANVLFAEFPNFRRRSNRTRHLDLGLVAVAVFSPVALILWYLLLLLT